MHTYIYAMTYVLWTYDYLSGYLCSPLSEFIYFFHSKDPSDNRIYWQIWQWFWDVIFYCELKFEKKYFAAKISSTTSLRQLQQKLGRSTMISSSGEFSQTTRDLAVSALWSTLWGIPCGAEIRWQHGVTFLYWTACTSCLSHIKWCGANEKLIFSYIFFKGKYSSRIYQNRVGCGRRQMKTKWKASQHE